MSTFHKPLRVWGEVKEGASADVGDVVLTQTKVIDVDADLIQEVVFDVPKNAQLIEFICDTLVAYDSATSATLSMGASSGDNDYFTSADVKTTGRESPSFTGAQLIAMADVGENTKVYATVTSVGQPTTGQVRVTLIYKA